MSIYVNSFLISLIGLGLSLLSVMYSLTKKAKAANVIFDWKLFFKADLIIQFIGTLLTVLLFLMLLGPFLEQFPKYANNTFGIMIFFATVGYVGSDIASRLFSVVNNRINGAIDYKTNQADEANGTLGIPTPALKKQPE
jgi:cell division protein FtsX